MASKNKKGKSNKCLSDEENDEIVVTKKVIKTTEVKKKKKKNNKTDTEKNKKDTKPRKKKNNDECDKTDTEKCKKDVKSKKKTEEKTDSTPKIKNKKKPIPKAVRMQVWRRDVGNSLAGKCYVCNVDIQIENFQCGHIIPESKGGENVIDNLKVVCPHCNLSCGVKSLDEFKKMFKNEKIVPNVKEEPKNKIDWDEVDEDDLEEMVKRKKDNKEKLFKRVNSVEFRTNEIINNSYINLPENLNNQILMGENEKQIIEKGVKFFVDLCTYIAKTPSQYNAWFDILNKEAIVPNIATKYISIKIQLKDKDDEDNKDEDMLNTSIGVNTPDFEVMSGDTRGVIEKICVAGGGTPVFYYTCL